MRWCAILTYVALTFALPLHGLNSWLTNNENAYVVWETIWLLGLAASAVSLAVQWWATWCAHRGYWRASMNTLLFVGLILYIAYGMISAIAGVI